MTLFDHKKHQPNELSLRVRFLPRLIELSSPTSAVSGAVSDAVEGHKKGHPRKVITSLDVLVSCKLVD